MNFKKALALLLVMACIFAMLAGCASTPPEETLPTNEQSEETEETKSTSNTTPDIDEDEDEEKAPVNPDVELKNLGVDVNAAGIGNGRFDGETTNTDFTVTYISGTENAYSYDEATKTLTFNALSADSAYSISGRLNGSIVINVGEGFKLDLQLAGLALRSSSASPILINSAKEITLSANSGTKSYVYDERDSASSTPASIHSNADLTVCGDGELFIQSAKNNGIQSVKSLQISSLSLVIECQAYALKGDESVTLKNCSTLLVAKSGDAIKTEATDISQATNQQNGTVSVLGGTHNIFASNDGIEAAYDVIVDYGSITNKANETKIVNTVLNVYTDTYSSYTDASAHDKPDLEVRPLYVCSTNAEYKYSVKLSTEDESKSEWVDPTFHESIGSSRRTYYTYKFYAKPEYTKMTVYIYSKDQALQNEETYTAKSNLVAIDSKSDTYRYSNRRWEWKTYESLVQNGSSNTPANPNEVEYSATGMRAANSVTVIAGTIKINSVGNAISANNQVPLDSKKIPTGNIAINGGDITITSKCNGVSSSGALAINGGIIKVLEAYEGIKATTITIKDGDISVISASNGFSATAKSGTGFTVSGGRIYVYAGAHGISSSSTASYTAITFDGGDIVIIAPAEKKSPIYSDGGYTYTDGRILAIMSKEGTRTDATHFYSFSQVGKFQEIELTENTYATVIVDEEIVVSAKVPITLSATIIYIGDKTVEFSSAQSSEYGEIYWRE